MSSVRSFRTLVFTQPFDSTMPLNLLSLFGQSDPSRCSYANPFCGGNQNLRLLWKYPQMRVDRPLHHLFSIWPAPQSWYAAVIDSRYVNPYFCLASIPLGEGSNRQRAGSPKARG